MFATEKGPMEYNEKTHNKYRLGDYFCTACITLLVVLQIKQSMLPGSLHLFVWKEISCEETAEPYCAWICSTWHLWAWLKQEKPKGRHLHSKAHDPLCSVVWGSITLFRKQRTMGTLWRTLGLFFIKHFTNTYAMFHSRPESWTKYSCLKGFDVLDPSRPQFHFYN